MKHRYFIWGFSALIIICICLYLFAPTHTQTGIAEIYSDGELLHKIDLSTVTEPYELTVSNADNNNKLYIEDGKISVIEASCPDKLCVKQGYSNSYPIVCLPNKLIIKFNSGDNPNVPDVLSR